MIKENEYVNIRIKRQTRDDLVIEGRKGQTYDDILVELLAFFDGPDKGVDRRQEKRPIKR